MVHNISLVVLSVIKDITVKEGYVFLVQRWVWAVTIAVQMVWTALTVTKLKTTS